jgi:hypothetical protein
LTVQTLPPATVHARSEKSVANVTGRDIVGRMNVTGLSKVSKGAKGYNGRVPALPAAMRWVELEQQERKEIGRLTETQILPSRMEPHEHGTLKHHFPSCGNQRNIEREAFKERAR